MENRTGASAPPAEESVNRAKSAAETALGDVKQVAQETASMLKSGIKEETGTVREKARQVVSDAQAKAADQARTAAATLRDTAGRVESDLPWMNTALNKTADGLERVTGMLNTGDMKQTVSALTQFARNHPALFLGASVAAGFALARVGKTALEGAHAGEARAGQGLVDTGASSFASMSEV